MAQATRSASDDKLLRAYYEATQRVKAETKDFPVGILITFLAVALHEQKPADVKEPLSLQELAEWTGQSPTSVSQHLRYLGGYYRDGKPGLGLVDTDTYPLNRRRKYAFLTPQGKQLANTLTYLMKGGFGDAGI